MDTCKEEDQESTIRFIMRQTNYDKETILEKLKEHENNIEKIIREFHGLSLEKKDDFQGSNNQKIFKTIREYF
jgi:hypothetical protein